MEKMLISGNIIFVAVFSVLMGMGMLLIWGTDILRGKFRGMGGFFTWKSETGEIMWPHITAELLTAASLICGGLGLLFKTEWAHLVAPTSLGALIYTSLNSLGWVLADKRRHRYAIPMIMGLVGGVGCLMTLLLRGQI